MSRLSFGAPFAARSAFSTIGALLALSATLPARAADEAAIHAAVDAAVRPVIARNDLPGLAVGVTVDGRAYVFNYGVASKATGKPVDDRTLFEVGSVSKTFNATLGAKALVDGRLSLSDHPGRYLPALKGHPIDRATLLQLGTYTAGGLPLQNPDGLPDDAAVQRWLRDWEPVHAPGTKRVYSNPSIGLFGRAVAAAIGRDFTEAVQDDLLPALGLRETHIRVPAAAMADYAWGYSQVKGEDKAVRVTPDVFDVEAYGIKTTAADLLRFVQVNIDPSGLPAPWRKAIEATQVGHVQVAGADGRDSGMVQGLGWEQYAWPVALDRWQAGNALGRTVSDVTMLERTPAGPRVFNKTGSTRGFGTYVAFIPSQRIGIVMLSNRLWPNEDRVAVAHAVFTKLQTMK